MNEDERMVHDPVISDLNQHLNALDRSESLGEAVDEKTDEIMEDREKVQEILEDLFDDDPQMLVIDLVIAMLGHVDDRPGMMMDILTRTREMVRVKAEEMAQVEVKKELDQALFDEGEDRAMRKEDSDDFPF